MQNPIQEIGKWLFHQQNCIENANNLRVIFLLFLFTGGLFVFADGEVKENTDNEKSDGNDLICFVLKKVFFNV